MATSGLRIGTFAGAPVVADWSVALLAAFVILNQVSRGGVGALPGALIWVAAIFASILVHEFAHASVAAALKLPSKRIVLTFFGGHVEFAWPPTKRWHDIAVSAAGPLSNLAFAGLIYAFTGGISRDAEQGLVGSFLNDLLFLNLILGVFNLLPGFPLDGGRMLSAALSYFMHRERARIVAGVSGILIAIAAAAFGLLNNLLWTFFIALILLLAAFVEIGAAQRALRAESAAAQDGGRSNT